MTGKYDPLFKCPSCGGSDSRETREEYKRYTRIMVNGVPSEKDYTEIQGDRLIRAECLNCGDLLYELKTDE